MACGESFQIAQSLALPMEIQQLLLIPNTLFQIPAPTRALVPSAIGLAVILVGGLPIIDQSANLGVRSIS